MKNQLNEKRMDDGMVDHLPELQGKITIDHVHKKKRKIKLNSVKV